MIDSHAHLSGEALLKVAEEMILRARDCGIEKILNICTDLASLQAGLLLREKFPCIENAAACPPHDVETDGALFFPHVEQAALKGQLLAIGETGLDAHYPNPNLQRECLLQYFDLALRVKLPLIFHCRGAFAELFAYADSHYRHGSAVIHCFTGTLEEAKEALNRGWYLSISGIVTFKKSEELRQLLPHIPLDRLLVETDAPYLAPQMQRGQVNEPSFLLETAECIGKVLGKTREEIGRLTAQNFASYLRGESGFG